MLDSSSLVWRGLAVVVGRRMASTSCPVCASALSRCCRYDRAWNCDDLSCHSQVGEIAAIHVTVEVLSLMLILAWVFLTVIGTLSVVLKSARTVRAASQMS